MDGGELPQRKHGSVKATITSFEQQIYGGNFKRKKSNTNCSKAKTAQWSPEICEYVKVMRELESVKGDCGRVKQDMGTILEQKRRAEEEEMCSSLSIEALTREIEEIHEEHLLVVVARVEALKECREVEAQRRGSVDKYLAMIEETLKKRNNIVQELVSTEEMEAKLAITIKDINKLKSEREEDKLVSSSLLETITRELVVTKKELAAVKEESFEFMAIMDTVGNELHLANEAVARITKKEEKANTTIQSLNSKLLRAKSNMEATSAEADRASSMVSNLSLTLEHLKSEGEAAKKELNLIGKQTSLAREEARKTENDIGFMEERLLNSLQDLKAVISSESKALDKLKALAQSAIRSRASTSLRSSKIQISKFEHDYLRGNAAAAMEIADKKIAAAEAWIEAIKAREEQIVLKTSLARKERRKLKVEKNGDAAKGSINAKKTDEENDFEQWRLKMEPESSRLPNNGASMTSKGRRRNSHPMDHKYKYVANPIKWALNGPLARISCKDLTNF